MGFIIVFSGYCPASWALSSCLTPTYWCKDCWLENCRLARDQRLVPTMDGVDGLVYYFLFTVLPCVLGACCCLTPTGMKTVVWRVARKQRLLPMTDEACLRRGGMVGFYYCVFGVLPCVLGALFLSHTYILV